MSDSRAVSSAIATILLVAILIVLATTISGAFLGVGSELREPAPNVAQSSGEFVRQEGFSGGIVRITHLAGDTVPVADLEIAIDATDACGRTARILNLPADNDIPDGQAFTDDNFENGDATIISEGLRGGSAFGNKQQWDAGVLHTANDNTFRAGSSFEFRIAVGECPLDAGDHVIVRVVHTPSNSVLVEKDLTA